MTPKTQNLIFIIHAIVAKILKSQLQKEYVWKISVVLNAGNEKGIGYPEDQNKKALQLKQNKQPRNK